MKKKWAMHTALSIIAMIATLPLVQDVSLAVAVDQLSAMYLIYVEHVPS